MSHLGAKKFGGHVCARLFSDSDGYASWKTCKMMP